MANSSWSDVGRWLLVQCCWYAFILTASVCVVALVFCRAPLNLLLNKDRP